MSTHQKVKWPKRQYHHKPRPTDQEDATIKSDGADDKNEDEDMKLLEEVE